MNDAELADLITGPETERVERKQSMSDADKIREAICAFANDLPASGLPGARSRWARRRAAVPASSLR